MRRYKVVWRPDALDDLEEIFRFILHASGDRAIARGFVQRIRERGHRIGDVPLGGAPRDDLAPGIRTMPFERRAVIAYRIIDATVEITNIVYGGRDFAALYRDRPGTEEEAPSSV